MSERLPTIKAKDLIRVLQKDGFVLAHQKGSHATYKHPLTQKRGLLRGILNDLNLTPEEFLKKL